MFLAQALNSIKNFEPNNDRRLVLVQTLKNPEKLAKTLLRIEFLTACRRNQISPRFIEDALRPLSIIFRDNASFQSRYRKLSGSLLNDAISEAHRRRAYLIRRRDRFASTISEFLSEDKVAYIFATCERIFAATIGEQRPRLLKKFQSRMHGATTKRRPSDDDSDGEAAAPENRNAKVNNLSSLGLTQASLALLSKGPNFALTQKISKTVLLEVEKGVERFAYAKRWKDAIDQWRQTATTATATATSAPAGGRDCDVSRDDRAPASAHLGRAVIEPSTGTQQTAPAPGLSRDRAVTGPYTGTRQTAPEPGAAENGETSARLVSSRSRTPAERTPTSAPSTGLADIDTGETSEATAPAARRTSTQSGLLFRFPDSDKRFPPPTNGDVERKMKRLKDDLIKTYQNHKSDHNNVSNDDHQFLKQLRSNDDIIIKQSDKCKGLVIMDKSTYIEKAQNIVGNTSNYDALDKNPVPKVEAQTKRVFKAVSTGKLPETTIRELTSNHSRTPVFYGLPKDHKPSIPLRPVISGCDGPTEKTSHLLERILKQLLKFVPTHLWNTSDFLNRIRSHSERHGVPDGAIFFSIDVINLYGSIPIAEAIDAAVEKLEMHAHDIDSFGLTTDDVRRLLEQCLNSNVFSFNGKYYRQKLGVAMGNPCAPTLAILFLDRFESQNLENMPLKPKFLVRYIDDYAGLWTHDEQSLKDFLDRMNTLHPTVKFTMEHSGGGSSVPFLDTLVTVEKGNGGAKIETELHIKPTNSGIILHYESAHPTVTKYNMARSQFQRAIRNSSSDARAEKSVEKVWVLLSENGYPNHILKRLLQEARRQRGLSASRSQRRAQFDGFLCLPYIDEELLCKVKQKVKRSGLDLRVAWQNKRKIKNKLVRSAMSRPACPGGRRCHTCATGFVGDCAQKNVVYEVKCEICQQQGEEYVYIGETKRPLRLRFNEHLRDTKHRTPDTPMGDHFQASHSNISVGESIPLTVKIIYKSKDHPDRKIAESLLIRNRRPKLNSNVSSWPIM